MKPTTFCYLIEHNIENYKCNNNQKKRRKMKLNEDG